MVEEYYLSKKNIFFYSIFSTSVPARVKQCNNNTIDDQPSKLKDSTLAACLVSNRGGGVKETIINNESTSASINDKELNL